MTPDTAQAWIQKHIAMGTVAPRTHERSCREVVVHYQGHPAARQIIEAALVAVIGESEWITAEQFENAAYLAVNLASVEALQQLVTGIAQRDDPSGDFATVGIAAIRSFPGDDPAHDRFLPALFHWLKVEPVAHLAYETLCDLSPEDAGAYLAALAHFHHGAPAVLEKALTHLYFRGGDTVQGAADVRALVEGFATLRQAISSHPFIPGDVKQELAKIDAVRPRTSPQPVLAILENVPWPRRSSYLNAGNVVRELGPWGVTTGVAA